MCAAVRSRSSQPAAGERTWKSKGSRASCSANQRPPVDVQRLREFRAAGRAARLQELQQCEDADGRSEHFCSLRFL
jgi:hypothetical protein